MIELPKELEALRESRQNLEKRYGITVSNENEEDRYVVSAVYSVGDKCFVGYGDNDEDALRDMVANIRQEEQTISSMRSTAEEALNTL